MTFVNEKSPSRTIDKEKNYILTSKGGAQDWCIDRRVFELDLDGNVFDSETQIKTEKNSTPPIIKWLVTKIKQKNNTAVSADHAFDVLQESLPVYSQSYRGAKNYCSQVEKAKGEVKWVPITDKSE